MIEVYEMKKVPENCSTCLYKSRVFPVGCAHAGRKDDWAKYAMLGYGCPSYWLDQNRFQRIDRVRLYSNGE